MGSFRLFIVCLWGLHGAKTYFIKFTNKKILCGTLRKREREKWGGGWGGGVQARQSRGRGGAHTIHHTNTHTMTTFCQAILIGRPRKRNQCLPRNWFLCLPFSAHECTKIPAQDKLDSYLVCVMYRRRIYVPYRALLISKFIWREGLYGWGVGVQKAYFRTS